MSESCASGSRAGSTGAPLPGLRGSRAALAAGAALAVGFATACKALLFFNLEYTASDLYSFLEMSRSWLAGAPLLHENAYGSHAAIHGFYLMLAFAPLTSWLGAYGLFAALGALQMLAALCVALTPALDLRGRLAVLGGLLSPIAWYVADDPDYGFHPELCYPPLAVLLAVASSEGRRVRALLCAIALALVKEDGALVCAAVLAAHHSCRLWALRGAADGARRRAWRAAGWSLGAALLAFAAGLLLLWWAGHGAPAVQETAPQRIGRAAGILWRTLLPGSSDARQVALLRLLAGYGVLALLVLLPLGRRLAAGLAVFTLATPAVLAVLLVSDAQYKFKTLLWAPRAATLMAVALACLVALVAGRRSTSRAGLAAAAALVLLSWGGQGVLLSWLSYAARERLDLPALWSARERALSAAPRRDAGLFRCLGQALPRSTPVSPPAELYPFFHQQSIVFQTLEVHARQPAQLWIAHVENTVEPILAAPACATVRAGTYRVVATCEVAPQVTRCQHGD
jgi:hypothetical protein